MRHAKSDWGDPTRADHDRPLNRRGRRAAPLIGRWLAAQGAIPDAVLTSSARRTRETWDRMAPAFPGRCRCR
ncbi:MAG: histidine phosphatase family protein [Rhodobacteraceae bacterium]|nr:histidine phosphatase family protein [Paracoccaceae bacterium]